MVPKVKGSRPVRQWLELVGHRNSSFYRKLDGLYGDGEALTRQAAQVSLRALEAFGESYGWDRSAIVARATGRVNLMGMHIDHRGGSVNPIAIKEVYLVAEARNDDVVMLRNVESEEFPQETFRIGDCLPKRKIENWDSWCHDELEKRRNDASVTWSNYVRAAVLYLQHLNTKDDGTFSPALRGMNAMVCGNVPRAAGLGSSSSIVVAAAEACVRINNLAMDPMEFVDACGYGEWYVGTRGGAGDHAAIKFGKPNSVLHITSFPLNVQAVSFPRGYKIVMANSLVEARKRSGARDAFNSRVASYIFGLMMVRRSFPQHAPKLRHLRDLNPDTLGVDEVQIYRMLRSLPESVNREQVLGLLPGQEAEVRHVFRSHAEPREGYRIREVCMYGVAECIRAEMAAERLKAGDVVGFGELISISHDGDRVTRMVNERRVPADNSYPDGKLDSLIRDLQSGDPERTERSHLWRQPGGYNCSLPEMDILVDIALDTPGVLGAGLVGAGLGGSIIALVEERRAQELIDSMAKGYYRPRRLPAAAEIVAPVGGAGIMDV